jgi:phenylalanyl-tRNA synthetase beta chain
MRVPYSWLLEYVKIDASSEELAHVLTMGGLEVEEVAEWTSEDGEATDQVLVTKVTSNRGDQLSMIGVARHAAALLDAPLELPDLSRPETDEPRRAETDLTEGDTRVQLVDVEGCPRYSALRITGVKVGPSPPWLAHRLEAAGIRPISNVVDATNYVVWEVGQPLHAFDHRLLVDRHIIVRRAEQGERLLMIDGQWRHLTAEDLVIADAKGAVAIAGIMGGMDTEVRELTEDVLLESAHFSPRLIRRSAQRIPLATEASYRFERYVDPNGTLPALARAAQLILQTAGGEVVGPALDVCARSFEPWQVSMRPQRCNAVLGTDLSAEQMAGLLERLGLEVESGEKLTVTVPTARPDLEREIDLIEEVAIVHGYDNIPTTLPASSAAPGLLTREQKLERRAREALRACGLCETLCFSMMGESDLDAVGLPPEAQERSALCLRDPMSEQENLMRTTMLPAMLAAASRNARQRVQDVALFEIGRVFLPGEGQLPEERRRLGAVMMGSIMTATWNLPEQTTEVDLYWVKGVVEQLFGALGIPEPAFEPAEHPTFGRGRCASVTVAGQQAGVFGDVTPEVREAYDLPGDAYAMELDLEVLLDHADLEVQYRPVPRLPAALRDLALVVPDDGQHSAAALASVVRQAAREELEKVEVFDVYRDPERIGEGNKQIALRLSFRRPDRTLTDEEVDALMQAIAESVQRELGARVRTW